MSTRLATVVAMADGGLPCTSVATPALREAPDVVARRLAAELLESRQRIMRGVGLSVGGGFGVATLVWSVVGLGGIQLLPLLILAGGVALSTSMLALALLSTVHDGLVDRRWARLMREHGVDQGTGARALADARAVLADRTARRLGEPA
jgi:hypothetical protein